MPVSALPKFGYQLRFEAELTFLALFWGTPQVATETFGGLAWRNKKRQQVSYLNIEIRSAIVGGGHVRPWITLRFREDKELHDFMDFDDGASSSSLDGESRYLASVDDESFSGGDLNRIRLRAMTINESIIERDVTIPGSLASANKSTYAIFIEFINLDGSRESFKTEKLYHLDDADKEDVNSDNSIPTFMLFSLRTDMASLQGSRQDWSLTIQSRRSTRTFNSPTHKLLGLNT
ncbi:hypothetical protein TRICI_002797 [Trichomonascus ciferrii]|uniref:Uncharacterized protein n=1 Tax=Trichomonascus ciferrii TaxID=44093 RepID=A0A642V5V9_9ASCO|nr:hypothetical protein TRICI_002797 [Trichomonascus ciferrii]